MHLIVPPSIFERSCYKISEDWGAEAQWQININRVQSCSKLT
jgi:hypothetical protein